jgi:hypothetical protein
MHTRRQQAIGCGCSFLAFAALAALAASLVGPFGPAIIAAAVLVVVVAVAKYQLHRRRLLAEFRARYAPSGKDVLIVYSDSPHWGKYIEASWLTRWGDRAVVFNRSRPWKSEQIEARLWFAIAGSAEHTPVAIVVRPSGAPQIVRFWRAFRERKHGDDAALRAAEERLDAILSGR